MKLILCKTCQDIFKLDTEKRTCKCGGCWGEYSDDNLHAKYGGKEAVALALTNSSLILGIHKKEENAPMGYPIEAYVVPENSPTFKRE